MLVSYLNILLGDITVLEVLSGTIQTLCPNNLVSERLLFIDSPYVQLEELQPECFSQLPKLRQINLKHNKLTEIVDGVFNGTLLSVINLEYNKISSISENAFDNMTDLLSLDLENNLIQKLNPNWFTNTTGLQSLALSFNMIEEIPERAFQYLVEFKGMTVYLMHNQIKKISVGAFANFRKHANILLNYNKIEEVPINILSRSNHTFSVSLVGNEITCINDTVLHNLASSCKHLDLSENPIFLECLGDIENYAKENENLVQIIYDK